MTNSMRIYLYSHNTRGLGHAARNAAIANGIYEMEPQTSILNVTGASAQISELLPPNADYVKLPSFDAVERNGEVEIVPQRLHVSKKELVHIRSAIIEAVALSFRPDVIVVDFSPVGKGGELIRMLEKARTDLPNTRIYLGIRDIVGQIPNNSSVYGEEIVKFINQHYDGIFYYGDSAIIPYEKDPFTLTHSKSVMLPVKTAGYITRQNEVNEALASAIRLKFSNEGDFLVVASAGGGKHSLGFFEAVINACKAHPQIKGMAIHLLMITGPYFTVEDQAALEIMMYPYNWMYYLKFIPNMVDYMGAADLFIGMGGYNTMAEMLVAKKPSIIVARQQADSVEQTMRARLFENLGICTCLLWDENLEHRLEEQILRLTNVDVEYKPKVQLDTHGKDWVAQWICQGLEG